MITGEDSIEETPRLLCVGGTDPTGAAGLFADLRAASAAGVFASGVVTAVTVQTSQNVSDVVALPASVVGAQLDAALQEPGAEVVKVGMLVNEDIVLALANRLGRAGTLKLVLDPVLASSSGRLLLSESGVKSLEKLLLPRAALITPNLPELAILSGIAVETRADMERGADLMLLRGAAAVLVKGGHAERQDEVHDLLRTADGDGIWISRSRRPGLFRGTGCTLAAAIAARLSLGLTLRDAVTAARDYLDEAMARALPTLPRLLGPVIS